MGNGASVRREDVAHMPQYAILGGDSKYEEVKNEDGTIDLSKIDDPYLKYGGAYLGDVKDTADFKYLTFSELPKFTPQHKSLMSKVLTAEVFEKLKDVKSSKGYTLSNVVMTGVVTPHLGRFIHFYITYTYTGIFRIRSLTHMSCHIFLYRWYICMFVYSA
ncbi:hypothetical protein EON63_04475 [archaeon]|nr:MAG: hypothetical protein EON63_04475 [archaeon]